MEAADIPEFGSAAQEQQQNTYIRALGVDLRDAAFIVTPMLMIIFAELIFFAGNISFAVWVHVITLVLLTYSTHWLDESIVFKIYQALMLLPILRLVNMSMPIFFEMTLYSYVFIYAPLIIPIYFVLSHQKFTLAQIGITKKNFIKYLPAAVIIGLILGGVEYITIKAGYLIPDLSIVSILKISIVMILFVGLVEELIFRSILQTRLEEAFGMLPGLVGASIMFGIMHSGYGTVYEIFFTSFAGFVMGWMFQKTRSLSLVAITHGCVNIFLFGVIPHLGLGLGLF